MKNYILKPGKHQFAPGSPAIHSNDNVTDEEAEWYLASYPHIAKLFARCPAVNIKPKEKRKKSPSKKEPAINNISK